MLDIKRMIKKKGFTYKDIAKMLNVSESSIKDLVNKGNPTYKTLEKLACVLGCEVRDFLVPDNPDYRQRFECPVCGAILEVKKK